MASKEYELKQAYIGDCSEWKPGSNTLAYRPLTSTTTVNDMSGNNRNLTNTNVTFGTYKGVDCAYFSGDNSCQLRNSSFLNVNDNSFTVLCWSYYISNGYTGNGNYDQIVRWWGTIGMRRDCYNSPYNKFLFSGCSNAYAITSDSGWILSVAIKDNANSKQKFYINGNYQGEGGLYTNIEYPAMFSFSNTNNQTTSYYKRWKGGISEVIVENRIWTDAEILDYYNKTKSLYGIS